jgi:hypothetical protein
MPWFDGFIGNWFIGCVFFSLSLSLERGENGYVGVGRAMAE